MTCFNLSIFLEIFFVISLMLIFSYLIIYQVYSDLSCFKLSFSFREFSCNFIDVDFFMSNHLKHHITNFSIKKYEGDAKIVGFLQRGIKFTKL